jgi:hypothetical protein
MSRGNYDGSFIQVNPFDIVNDISLYKKRLIEENNEDEYNSFKVNRAFSYFVDTIMYASDMNLNSHISKLMQHDYLLYSIRKKERFRKSKWSKPKKDDDIESIQEYYGYSRDKALTVLSVLTDEQLKIIKKKLVKGGL